MNTENQYTPARQRAQKKYYDENKLVREHANNLAGAKYFVKWLASESDMIDLQHYFTDPNYKAPHERGNTRQFTKQRSKARKYVRFEDADWLMLYELYMEYKDHRDEWAE